MYLDTCYIVKFYLNEIDSGAVRQLVISHRSLQSSGLAVVEFHATLHRRFREGAYTSAQVHAYATAFEQDVQDGLWALLPVTETLLHRTSLSVLGAPPSLFLRAGDAIHLATAQRAGEREIWSSDRHLLAAAPYFGLTGRSV